LRPEQNPVEAARFARNFTNFIRRLLHWRWYLFGWGEQLGLHRASFDHKKSLLAALYRSDFFLRKARRALAHVRGKQKGSGVVSTTGANLEPAGRK
jgi:hypothetical protein